LPPAILSRFDLIYILLLRPHTSSGVVAGVIVFRWLEFYPSATSKTEWHPSSNIIS